MPDRYVVSFLALLSNFIDTYQKLLFMANKKREILVAGDIERLAELISEETEIILTAGKMENQRRKLIEEWGEAENWPKDDLTIEFILTQLEPPHAEEARQKVMQLKQFVAELKETNTLNGALLERALEFVNYSLELLTGGDTGMTYGVNGYADGRKNLKILDQKI
jgi:flagellar biosynthesis/type III secretory pathway chaperone